MPDEQRPAPLTPSDCNLQDFEFMPVVIRRLLKSDTWVLGTDSERSASVALWLESWHQVPAASLPDNERMLQHLAQARTWPKVREHVMRGWTMCSDGRYYHPVVAVKALEAWIEKLVAAATGGATNYRRWGHEFDSASMLARCLEAVSRLQKLDPASKTLKKKAVVAILNGVLPGSGADQKPPSGAGSGADSGKGRNREGQGEGQGQGQGQGEGQGTPAGKKTPPTPRKRGTAPAALIGLEQLLEAGVDRQHAEDWLVVRKEKNLPLTRSAWAQVVNEAAKVNLSPPEAVAYCAANSWGGFKHSWIERDGTVKPTQRGGGNRQEQLEQRNRGIADNWSPGGST